MWKNKEIPDYFPEILDSGEAIGASRDPLSEKIPFVMAPVSVPQGKMPLSSCHKVQACKNPAFDRPCFAGVPPPFTSFSGV